MDIENNPWDEEKSNKDEEQKGEGERPPSIEDFPQPELQIVPPTQKSEITPPMTPEDLERQIRKDREKFWKQEPPMA